eukprot:2140787-Lingulodinium_polyedra.AAC.1
MVGGPRNCGMSLGMSCSSAGRAWDPRGPSAGRSCQTLSLFSGARSGLGPCSSCHSRSASLAFRRCPVELRCGQSGPLIIFPAVAHHMQWAASPYCAERTSDMLGGPL